jgi:hypothetical protein
MVLSRAFEPPDLLVTTLVGRVTPADQSRLVDWVRGVIQMAGPVRLLVRLRQFEGWTHDAAFDNPSLWLHDDEGVSRIAIVGSPDWQLAMLSFIVQPLRRIPIEYFETEDTARRWLEIGAISPTPAPR